MRIMLRLRVVKEISMEFIEATFWMGRDKDMEHLNGIMERNFKVIGKMVLKMDSVFGDLLEVIAMKVNGLIIGNMVKECLNTRIVLTEDNFKISLSTAKANRDFWMVTVISVNINKVNLMEKENMCGMMADNMKGNSKMV